MADRHWSDQPAVLAQGSVSCIGYLRMEVKRDTVSAEVFREQDLGVYWLTVGNLFGSETVECPTARHLVDLLCCLGSGEIPEGCTLLTTK